MTVDKIVVFYGLMNDSMSGLTPKRILRFWWPLEASWLMMAIEGPFIAAVIARLSDAKFNLAAFGVAFSLAWMVEAPTIMMLSASNALVRDRMAYVKLRRFSFTLNGAVTVAMAIIFLTPFHSILYQRWLGLPVEVAHLTWKASLLLIPWPGAIGYRRFYQGILIGNGKTHAVAIGTMVRLVAMAGVGTFSALALHIPGAMVGGAALSAGVVAEAAASRFMVRNILHGLKKQSLASCDFGNRLDFPYIWRFYLPLALTSILQVGVHPLVTFFMGRSRFPIESLAVIPVINSFTFIFRSPGIAYQETVIALYDGQKESYASIRGFAFWLGLFPLLAMFMVTATPLSGVWFGKISGLSAELSRFAALPAVLLSALPMLEAMLSLQRGVLVGAHRTEPIIVAAAVHIGVLFISLSVAISVLHSVGIVAAAFAHVLGYATANVVLMLLRRQRDHFGRNH